MSNNIKIKTSPGVGNKVSKSERKVKRKYNINIQKFKLYSNISKSFIVIKCSCKQIREINRYSNIDRYLIHSKNLLPELYGTRIKILNKINNNKYV